MSIENSKGKDHKPLSPPPNGAKAPADQPSLFSGSKKSNAAPGQQNLVNLSYNYASDAEPAQSEEQVRVEQFPVSVPDRPVLILDKAWAPAPTPQAESRAKQVEKARSLLDRDRWLIKNGHTITYIGLYLFSILVLFRPYEIVPGLGFLVATAFYFAMVTLAIYIPSQVIVESNLTIMTTEVKAIFALTLIALITMPIAKDPEVAWKQFNDPYIKAVIIFIVLINVVRTRKRLMGLMWLSLGIAVYLGTEALAMYINGQFRVEKYRVAVEVGGMFGNPNEMALHFVMMTPLAITLGLASKGIRRWIFLAMGVLFVGANMVTFSRGGFVGLVACAAVLAWKLGRKYRLNVTVASILILILSVLASPENYGKRVLSILFRGMDAAGSSDQRKELLQRSLLVTARNPWGIGIGNFPIVGVHNLGTHNAFTQVSSELGILGLIVYLIFMISPFRKLRAIERLQFDADRLDWFYYMSIGLQASVIGYMVTSFFASVAYNWFIYYLIAYAVAFRRIYSVETGRTPQPQPLWEWEWPKAQTA
jgi:putative inorganic carbon (HCO3(-)) transporter